MDSLSGYNGIGINTPTYYTPGINGYGYALFVKESEQQYVSIPKYRNLLFSSFTIEMWLYPNILTGNDDGLFSQNYAQVADQSLHCTVRNSVMFLGFFYDDLGGSTTIETKMWYHVAFVFDYSILTQKIYLNGILDATRHSSCYQGLNTSISIGRTAQRPDSPDYFTG